MRLNSEELLDRLQLIRSENIGACRFQALLARFGSAKAALAALANGAAAFAGKNAKKPVRLASRDEAERELLYAEKIGARFIALEDSAYPLYLRECDAPPPLLAVMGNIGLLTRQSLAIVGSRNASAVGRQISGLFARSLGSAGFVICSGFARGIDSYAHKAALQTGTVAVVAGGVDHIYPPENKKLYQEILAEGGAFISEMPLRWQPRAMDFPRRNRLIAALSLGLLVVEASERSGSLISARYAAEAGRIVFATPGSPLDPRAKGTNTLIKNGAVLVDDPQDIVDILTPLMPAAPARLYRGQSDAAGNAPQAELFAAPCPRPQPAAEKAAAAIPAQSDALTAEEQQLLRQSLSPTPIAIDSLAQILPIPLSRLYLGLMELELAGCLIRHNGGMVSALPD